jgi:Holliday junction resolvasome RuvABC DNA-binding subunit
VGTNADVAALVQAVLALARTGQLKPVDAHEQDNAALARQALVQLGFSSATAAAALTAAREHVEPDAPLELLIKEALWHCR